jgi:hypothetical protein
MNEAPEIKDTSHGMWRRIMVIYFPRLISEDEMDRGMFEKIGFMILLMKFPQKTEGGYEVFFQEAGDTFFLSPIESE